MQQLFMDFPKNRCNFLAGSVLQCITCSAKFICSILVFRFLQRAAKIFTLRHNVCPSVCLSVTRTDGRTDGYAVAYTALAKLALRQAVKMLRFKVRPTHIVQQLFSTAHRSSSNAAYTGKINHNLSVTSIHSSSSRSQGRSDELKD